MNKHVGIEHILFWGGGVKKGPPWGGGFDIFQIFRVPGAGDFHFGGNYKPYSIPKGSFSSSLLRIIYISNPFKVNVKGFDP